MKTLLSVLVLGMAAISSHRSAQADEAGKPNTMLKAVFHINFADPERHEHALGNIENVLKEVGDDQVTIEVVCHGKGLAMLVEEKSSLKEKIAGLSAKKVRFKACENTMRKEKITKEQLLSGVDTVPSGAVEVVRKQRDGFSYFKP